MKREKRQKEERAGFPLGVTACVVERFVKVRESARTGHGKTLILRHERLSLRLLLRAWDFSLDPASKERRDAFSDEMCASNILQKRSHVKSEIQLTK